MPVIMTTAAMGLKWGTAAKAAHEATARATMTANSTISRAAGRRRSNPTRKGARAAPIMKMLIR